MVKESQERTEMLWVSAAVATLRSYRSILQIGIALAARPVPHRPNRLSQTDMWNILGGKSSERLLCPRQGTSHTKPLDAHQHGLEGECLYTFAPDTLMLAIDVSNWFRFVASRLRLPRPMCLLIWHLDEGPSIYAKRWLDTSTKHTRQQARDTTN